MNNYCDNFGCKMYSGRCTNCHEELYILDQYDELNMEYPDEDSEFMQKVREQQKDVSENSNKKKVSEARDWIDTMITDLT